jgi:hypothetical protein
MGMAAEGAVGTFGGALKVCGVATNGMRRGCWVLRSGRAGAECEGWGRNVKGTSGVGNDQGPGGRECSTCEWVCEGGLVSDGNEFSEHSVNGNAGPCSVGTGRGAAASGAACQ